VGADDLRTLLERSGFRVTVWDDLTRPASEMMRGFLAAAPCPLGLHNFVPDFAAKARDVLDNLDAHRAGSKPCLSPADPADRQGPAI